MEGAELRERINEVAKCIREMDRNGTRRSRPGTYRLLKEKQSKLLDQWQQSPDAAEYARNHPTVGRAS